MTWRDHAACKGVDTDLFYPSEHDDRDLRQHARVVYTAARQICMACPVRAACLDDALAAGEVSYGMRGGMSPTERRGLLGHNGRHGLASTYIRGCRCHDCDAAYVDYRTWKATQ